MVSAASGVGNATFLNLRTVRFHASAWPTFEERNRIVKKFINLLKDVSGASAAEYALILAIVGAAIALAAFNLGGAIADAMNDARTCIETGTGSNC